MSEEFKPTAPHVYTAIAEVTAKLAKTGISKDRKNTQQNYKFRGIDDVYNALSSTIAEAKLCLLPRVVSRSVTERETKNGGVLFYVVCDVDFDLVSAVDGSSHTVHVIGEAMDSADKATNKAMSAAYKYMAMQVFCIPTEGDNDADATTHDGIKPGIGVHSPYGDLDPRVADLAIKYADAFREALASGDVHKVQADMRTEVDEKGEPWGDLLALATWKNLDSTTRASIKKALLQKEAA
jgi:hypothetical protein